MTGLRWAAFLLFSLRLWGAEPKWIHLPSADFDIFSSAGEGDTRRVLQQFERVRNFFAQKAGPGGKPQGEAVRVIVFGSKKEYEPYRPNEFAAAFYTQRTGRDYIVLGGVGDQVFPTAIHEYVHLVAQHAGLNLPPWLNEGMAELYSTLKPFGGKVLVGSLIRGRLMELQLGKWVPLATILAADRDSPYYNEKDQAGSLYNEGWALTHMLELSPQYSAHFMEAFGLIAKGTASQEALEKVYGKPLSAIEKDLQSYLRRGDFNGSLFNLKLDAGAKGTTEPAEAFEVQLTLLDLNDRRGKEAEALQKFAELARQYPTRPEAQAALGYLAWRTGNCDGAVKAFAAAFDLGGRNPKMLWDYGRLVGGSDQAAGARALSALLIDQPGRLDVRLELAAMQVRENQPKDALATLAPIKAVTPADAPRLFELLAFAKMQSGDREAARLDGLRWIENAKQEQEKDRAKGFLQALSAGTTTATFRPLDAPVLADEPEDGPPRLTRTRRADDDDAPAGAGIELPTIHGDFGELDCSGPTPRMLVLTQSGPVALLMDQPDRIIISGLGSATVDLSCGKQKSAPVSIQYEPATGGQTGVEGSVRTIKFEGRNQME